MKEKSFETRKVKGTQHADLDNPLNLQLILVMVIEYASDPENLGGMMAWEWVKETEKVLKLKFIMRECHSQAIMDAYCVGRRAMLRNLPDSKS